MLTHGGNVHVVRPALFDEDGNREGLALILCSERSGKHWQLHWRLTDTEILGIKKDRDHVTANQLFSTPVRI